MPQVTKEFNDLNDAKIFLAKLPGFCNGVIYKKRNIIQVLFHSSQNNPDDQRNKYEKRIDSLRHSRLNRRFFEA